MDLTSCSDNDEGFSNTRAANNMWMIDTPYQLPDHTSSESDSTSSIIEIDAIKEKYTHTIDVEDSIDSNDLTIIDHIPGNSLLLTEPTELDVRQYKNLNTYIKEEDSNSNSSDLAYIEHVSATRPIKEYNVMDSKCLFTCESEESDLDLTIIEPFHAPLPQVEEDKIIGTCAGRISTPFIASSLYKTIKLNDFEVPDKGISIIGASRSVTNYGKTSLCNCKMGCMNKRCECYKNNLKCSTKCHVSLNNCCNK
ncbi:uncharacterized protein LOC135923677 isoform X4 [Gordionus sp. m RMFG-2023]|uniref:uncharacterized protein LOC135923677 isoform X4 n=1 Tax=Gordionus sp. m RMFG-2023 TaxID=3053472 RepID=UPI0031FD0977